MNALPQATALQLESRQPTTAEILAYAAGRKKMWFSPQAAPRKQEAHRPILIQAAKPEVDEASLTPVQFLKQLCRKAGVGYLDMTSPSRTAAKVKDRDKLVMAVYNRYPHLTVSDLTRLFNRDRATIHKCLARCGIFRGARKGVSGHAKEIERMLRDGLNYAQIGSAIGFTGNAVSEYVRTHGLAHLAAKKRNIADHSELIEAMFFDGKTHPEIAAVINFDPSGVCRFIKRKGWKR